MLTKQTRSKLDFDWISIRASTYPVKSQYSCSLVDAQHGDTFRCCKANLRQRVQGVLPAEKSTYHLQASDTALHAVMLVNNLNITHKQLQYRRFCRSVKFQIAPMINLLAII